MMPLLEQLLLLRKVPEGRHAVESAACRPGGIGLDVPSQQLQPCVRGLLLLLPLPLLQQTAWAHAAPPAAPLLLALLTVVEQLEVVLELLSVIEPPAMQLWSEHKVCARWRCCCCVAHDFKPDTNAAGVTTLVQQLMLTAPAPRALLACSTAGTCMYMIRPPGLHATYSVARASTTARDNNSVLAMYAAGWFCMPTPTATHQSLQMHMLPWYCGACADITTPAHVH
jgi:hypothetical protein